MAVVGTKRRFSSVPPVTTTLSCVVVTFVLALTTTRRSFCDAAIACNETYNPCEELLWKGSQCRNGVCSNPFEKGCLYTLLNTEDLNQTVVQVDQIKERMSALLGRLKSQVRVCNSDDPLPESAVQGLCIDHKQLEERESGLYSEYREIRILSQNWESAYFASWILQILLSEILHLPASIESGDRDISRHNNFYDPESRLGYGGANLWDALERASNEPISDCTKVQQAPPLPQQQPQSGIEQQQLKDASASYLSCGHVIPEFWVGHNAIYEQNLLAGNVEPSEGLGAIGQQALFRKYSSSGSIHAVPCVMPYCCREQEMHTHPSPT